jgi:uncharacterized protein YciI
MSRPLSILSTLAALSLCAPAMAQEATPAPVPYDPVLAQELGADKRGMRPYILAILKTGPRDAEITDQDQRAALFAGHFANMAKLAEAGQLVLAGPLGGEDGRRGLFILNAPDIEAARALVATDPTVEAGIFIVDFNRYYGSAALMMVNSVHARIQEPQD